MIKDIFSIPRLGPLLRSPWPWRLLRLTTLLLLLATIAWGWHQHAIPGVKAGDALMYTNLANHLFWVWWLMGVVLLALLFGRSWCAVCPLGWLNGLVSRLGLRRNLPAWLRNFIPVTLALVALQVAVYVLAVHRYPDYTARLLALLLLLVVVCGLVFRQRAFCMLLCPAGAVFGLYARIAPWELRVRNSDTCAACEGRDCVSGGHTWKRFSLGRGIFFWHGERNDCPVDLVPGELTHSRDCTLCLHCVHNCRSGNLRLGTRPWLGDLKTAPLSPSESLFLVVLLGMLTANFSKVYVDLREAIVWIPQQTALLLGWQSTGFEFLAAIWVALLLPLLLLLPAWAVWRLADLQVSAPQPGPGTTAPAPPDSVPPADPGFWRRLGHLGLPLIPLLLAVHLILAVVKINAKAGYLPFALRDPSGVQSYLAINVMKTASPPGLLLPLDVLKWLVLAVLVGGWLLSLLTARRSAASLPGQTSRTGYLWGAAIAVTLPAALYLATLVRWLFIR